MVKVNAAAPLHARPLCEALGNRRALLIAEEASGVGCVGQRIAAILAENGVAPQKLVLCNLNREFPKQGTAAELQRQFGLDAASLAEKAAEVTA